MDPDFDDDANMVQLWKAWQEQMEKEAAEAAEQGRPLPKEPEGESTYQPGDEKRSVDGGSSRLSPCSMLSDDDNVTSTQGQVTAGTIISSLFDTNDDDATTSAAAAIAVVPVSASDITTATSSAAASVPIATASTTTTGSSAESAARKCRLDAVQKLEAEKRLSNTSKPAEIPSTSSTITHESTHVSTTDSTVTAARASTSSTGKKKKPRKRKKKNVAKEVVKQIIQQLLRSRRGEESESEISGWEGEYDPNDLDTTNMTRSQIEVYKKEQAQRKKLFEKKKRQLIEQNEILEEAGLHHLKLPTSISEMTEDERMYTRQAMTDWLVSVPSEVKIEIHTAVYIN